MTMQKRGFTLIELTLVIAVIGVLAAILLPGLARAREAARRASCQVNLMNLSIIFQAYATEHERQLPWSGGEDDARCLRRLRGEYVADMDTFLCPSASNGRDWPKGSSKSTRRYGVKRSGPHSVRVSYDYLGCYTNRPITMPFAKEPIPRMGILWDQASFEVNSLNHIPGGCNVLFLDGSIEFIKFNDFEQRLLPVVPQGVGYHYTPADIPPPPKNPRK